MGLKRLLRRAAPLALLAALGACAASTGGSGSGTDTFSTTQSVTPVNTSPAGFALWTDSTPDYRFFAGDKLRVQYLHTPEMSEDTTVAPDGMIGLRAADQVMAAGKTPSELQRDIAAASLRNLTAPVVTVSLLDSAGAKVFVGGMVTKPGAFPLDGRRGAFEAVVLAGGFTPEARMDQVVLIRRNPQNRPMLRTIDLRDFASIGTADGDRPLAPGDIVFVPRNRISEVDLWIDQFINKFLPFNRGFSYTINKGTPVF